MDDQVIYLKSNASQKLEAILSFVNRLIINEIGQLNNINNQNNLDSLR